MKDFAKFLTYLVSVAALSALAAPWLYHAGQSIGRAVPALGFLVETDFSRYFTRSFLLVAVLLLWPAVRWMRIRSVSELGLRRNPRRFSDLGFGLALPIPALWVYGAVLLTLSFYKMKDPLPWHRIPAAVGTAISVAFVEEAFFRGGLLGLLRRTASFWTASILLSVLFAGLHFLKPPEGALDPANVGWASGFQIVPQVFHQFTDPGLVLAGCTTLFLMSVILCYATARTQSLWLPIGLHAGLVLGARSFNILAQRRSEALPWIGEDLRIGLLPVLVLLALWGAVALYLNRTHPARG